MWWGKPYSRDMSEFPYLANSSRRKKQAENNNENRETCREHNEISNETNEKPENTRASFIFPTTEVVLFVFSLQSCQIELRLLLCYRSDLRNPLRIQLNHQFPFTLYIDSYRLTNLPLSYSNSQYILRQYPARTFSEACSHYGTSRG